MGILAYELLVGYPPFEQESRAATYEHIMYKEPKFPAWMSEEARKFICLALCKVSAGGVGTCRVVCKAGAAPDGLTLRRGCCARDVGLHAPVGLWEGPTEV